MPDRNRCGTTRNGAVAVNTHDVLKWCRSSARLIYDVQQSNFAAGIEFPGKDGVMISVEYPPGSADRVLHHHYAQAFVFVLEGSIIMQVRGGEMTLTPGQTSYEGPDDVHVIGGNASKTQPAKFVVFLVKDKGAPILMPAN